MAYNVLKGTVEGSVDQHADQDIEGVKVFKNTISASVFYDTDAQSPCATLKDVAVNNIENATKHGVVTFKEAGGLRVEPSLTFRDNTLHVRNIEASLFKGSAEKMINLPGEQICGTIDAKHIGHAAGLHVVRGQLQVKCGPGITLEENNVSVALSSAGGLGMKEGALVIDPNKAQSINTDGQNLSDNDLLLIADTSHNTIRNTTLKNLYEKYVKVKMPEASGALNHVQLKGRSGFASSPKLVYDDSKNTLNVEGKISTTNIDIDNLLRCRGSISANIKTIVGEYYEVEDTDYTILCDSIKTPITVMLPPACNHVGRILNIKKTNQNKYSLRSFPVAIKVSEGLIDIGTDITMKMNYSSRTIQSDGKNWWVIGSKGT
jgi:hypothetical protein